MGVVHKRQLAAQSGQATVGVPPPTLKVSEGMMPYLFWSEFPSLVRSVSEGGVLKILTSAISAARKQVVDRVGPRTDKRRGGDYIIAD